MVPMLDLKRQYVALKGEIEPLLLRLCETQFFILGPEVAAFEAEIAAYSGTSHAVGVSSGTDALLAALMALDIKPGDEVITSPFTFFATAGTIHRLGARPVFVDIDPDSYNLAPEHLAAAVTKQTRAIMPVHLFGQCADLDPILEVAGEFGLPVVEDAAQAIGAEYCSVREGTPRVYRAGSMGLMGCLSFFPSKNLGAFGDGGMVLTNDEGLAERLRRLRMHGQSGVYEHAEVGGNFRLDALQAAVLRVKLPHLDEWSARRRHNARRYRELFTALGLADRIVLPGPAAYHRHEEVDGRPVVTHIYNQFVIRVPRREEVREQLKAAGIGHAVYYPLPLHRQPCFLYLGLEEGAFPEAERACREVLALPVFPELSADEQQTVVEVVTRALE
jgi:dTDP-4-amino-4,6-dideoxygalactose transaminase